MKKWILAVCMLGMIGAVYAAGGIELQQQVTVGNKTYAVGTQGTQVEGVTFSNPVTVNGTTYPAGTKFTVLKTASGELVPITANTAGVAATGAAVGGGLTTATAATVVTIAAVVAVATNNNKNGPSTTVTVTQ